MFRYHYFLLLILLLPLIPQSTVQGCSFAGPVDIRSTLKVYDLTGDLIYDKELKDGALGGDCGFYGHLYYNEGDSFILEDPSFTYQMVNISSNGVVLESFDELASLPEKSPSGARIQTFDARMGVYYDSMQNENGSVFVEYETYSVKDGTFTDHMVNFTEAFEYPYDSFNDSIVISHSGIYVTSDGSHVVYSSSERIQDTMDDDYNFNITTYFYSSLTGEITEVSQNNSANIGGFHPLAIDPFLPQIITNFDAQGNDFHRIYLDTGDMIGLNVDMKSNDFYRSSLRGDNLMVIDYGTKYIVDLQSQTRNNLTLDIDHAILTDNYIVGGTTNTDSRVPVLLVPIIAGLMMVPIIRYVRRKGRD